MPLVRNFYNDTYTDDNGNKQKTDPSEPWFMNIDQDYDW
jgi:hypothetical protein